MRAEVGKEPRKVEEGALSLEKPVLAAVGAGVGPSRQ